MKRIIWESDYDVKDFEDSFDEFEVPEEVRDEYAFRIHYEYLEDERMNLDIELEENIVILADLGLWFGRRDAYKEIGNNISEVLSTNDDYITWYVDGNEVYTTPKSQANIIPDEAGRIMMNVWPGTGVDDWLSPYNGVTSLYAYYDWMSWDAPKTGGSQASGSVNDPYTDGQAKFDGTRVCKLTSKVSGKAVDVSWGNPANGTNVLQYPYMGYANQQWYIKKQANNYYIIQNVATGKVLSVQNQSTENGANVHQWEYTGNASQEWSIWQMSDGTYKIVNRQSGKCLNLQDSSLADNANIQQWQETPWSQSFYWNIDYVY